MSRRGLRRAGLVLAGVVMGLFGLAIGLWFYLEAARVDEIRSNIGARLQVVREAIVAVDVVAEDALRVVLRDVVLFDEAGDTVVASPRVALTLDATTLEGDGAIEFFDVELTDPYARLLQAPSGAWNFEGPLGLAAGGAPVEAEGGRPLHFRGITLSDGRALIAMPAGAPAEPEAAFAINLPRTTIGGVPYQVYDVANLDAELPFVRIGGPQGWRLEIESLAASLREPEMRIDQLAGSIEQEGEDGVRFALDALRFGDSSLTGDGLVRFSDAGSIFDLELRATALRMADLQPLLPALPAEGTAAFVLGVESLTPERLALRVSGLDAELLGSRATGAIAFAAGGDAPFALLGAELELDPLDLETLAALGLVEDLPVRGSLVGSVTTAGAAAGSAIVDLVASLTPADEPGLTPSTLLLAGEVPLGDDPRGMRLDGLVVGVQPLYLATLRSAMPENAEMLRGEVRGAVTLGGTLEEVLIQGGELTYRVADAPPSTLTQLAGRIALAPELRYELSAVAQPLALATLTELFPALPFRQAALTGPIAVNGDAAAIAFSADLASAAGGIDFAGSVAFGEPLSFDIGGSVAAFQAGMLLQPEVPLEGPLTGTFAASGTLDDLAFDVDLAQAEGGFALSGRVLSALDDPVFDVSGEIEAFRIGALLGSPQLFPDPMTGPLSLQGGGGAPYRFDVDLAGQIGRLDLSGFYQAGAVPEYAAQGVVVGLDASRLPFNVGIPATQISGSIDIRGQGLDPETLAGTFAVDIGDSSIAGLALDAAVARVTVAAGVMFVDTLHAELDRTRLNASGSWGLTTPAAEPLSFSLVSPELGTLSRLLAPTELVPPQLAGSLAASGTVGGSLENPQIVATLEGSGLRYEEWTAERLEADLNAARSPTTGWRGTLALDAQNFVLPQVDSFESLRLEASGDEQALAVGLLARRDRDSDLALSGVLELEGIFPRGVGLQTMELRLDGTQWRLIAPARVRYAGSEGLTVENLQLERVGADGGLVAVNGVVPASGFADLTVRTVDFDLADLRRFTDRAPELEGRVTLDAILSGPVTAPELVLNGRLEDVEVNGVSTDLITLDGSYTAGRLELMAAATAENQELFQAQGSIPMELSLADMLPSFELLRTAPLTATIVADSLPLSLIAAAAPGLADGAGVARAEIQVGGTIDVPSFGGWMRVDDGAITVEQMGIRYTQIEADLRLDGSEVAIERLGVSSGGRASASGTIAFPRASAPVLALDATFSDFRVMDDPAVASIGASGDLRVTGPLSSPVVTGRVVVSESTIQVPELGANQPGLELGYVDVTELAPFPESQPAVIAPPLGDIRVDGVEVALAESVWLESDELTVQITGDLILYRTGEDLRVFGALQAVRGTYALEINAIVREFDVISGRVQFFGTGDLNPSIDILGGYRVRGSTVGSGGDITILIQVTGTLLSPSLQLTADTPVPLSEADLISYLIFGQPSFELGGVTRAFAEQILVQEVVGGIVATGLERPLLRAGICDWVRVRPGVTTTFNSFMAGTPLAGAVVECGWEVAPDLFLTGQAGIGGFFGGDFGEGRLGVEWQIDDQWMWEASFGTVQRDPIFRALAPSATTTQFSTDLRRRWEYGEPRQDSEVDLTPDTATPAAGPPPLPATPDVGVEPEPVAEPQVTPVPADPPPAAEPADPADPAAEPPPPPEPPPEPPESPAAPAPAPSQPRVLGEPVTGTSGGGA